MKHLRLFLFTLAAVLGMSAYAQKDVTSQYITNATLSDGTNGWTKTCSKNKETNDPADAFSNSVRGNNTAGYASEAYAGWGELIQTAYSMKQTITLPAGHYTLVSYSFFRQGQSYNTNASKSLAYLIAGDQQVAIKTLGSITASGYANSQAEGANVFDSKMYRNTLDFTIDADNTSIDIGVEGTFDEMKSWCIVGMFELIDNDQPATMDSPFDVTGYITNPGFEYRDMTGWTSEPAGYIETQNNNQGFKVGGYYAQKWQSSNDGALPEGKMSQTITSLPAGYYKLKVNLGGNGTYVDLNGKRADWTADKDYEVGYVLAENEDLTITAGKTAEGTANWIHFDNFKLYFCGDVAKALEDLCNKVTDYQEKLPAAAYTELKNNVDAKNTTYTDVDELLAAIDAVNKLYEDADALIPIVDSYNAALKRANTAAATTDKIYEQLRTNLNTTIEDNSTLTEQTADAYTAAAKALNEAAAAVETSANSYKIIASGSVPTDKLDGWVTTNTNVLQVNTWSKEADNTGMVTPFIENWVYKDNVLGDGEVYYTLAGLEPGEVYFAQALVRAYSEAGNVPNGPNFFINDVVTNMTAEGSSFTYNDMKGYYGTLGGTATVGEDGTIRLGVKISGANYNWVAFKNVAIQSMDAALQAAIDNLQEKLDANQVPSSVESGAQALISQYTENKPTTAEDYEAAIQALNAKADEVVAIASAYAAYLKEKTVAKTIGVEVGEDPVTAEALLAGVNNLKVAEYNYVATEYPYDYAPVIGTFGEWTGTATVEGNSGTPHYLTTEHWSGTPRAYYEQDENGWGANAWTIKYEKTATLPAGDYILKVAARASESVEGTLSCSATDVTMALPNVGAFTKGIDLDGKASFEGDNFARDGVGFGWEWRYLPFTLTKKTKVTMTVYGETNVTHNWMSIADGTLLSKQEIVNEVTIAGTDATVIEAQVATKVTTDRKLLSGLNTIVLPFEVTAEEIGAATVLAYTGTTAEQDATTVTLNFMEVTPVDGVITLQANTPYAVFVDVDQIENLTFDKTKNIAPAEDITTEDANGKFDFVGTYIDLVKGNTTVVNGDMVAGEKEFKKAKGGNRIAAYRAYLKKMTSTEPTSVAFNFDGEIVNGIEAVEILNRLSGEGDIYNLNGQKVNRTERGIYIINGKKVVVK